jgi:hypothetical protein
MQKSKWAGGWLGYSSHALVPAQVRGPGIAVNNADAAEQKDVKCNCREDDALLQRGRTGDGVGGLLDRVADKSVILQGPRSGSEFQGCRASSAIATRGKSAKPCLWSPKSDARLQCGAQCGVANALPRPSDLENEKKRRSGSVMRSLGAYLPVDLGTLPRLLLCSLA